MLKVDTVLQERYRIVRQLGQGGMGAVYEAIDTRIDKTVAIKEVLLESEITANTKQKNRIKKAFRREAKSLVKAEHETVPNVSDFFEEFDRRFLVMEYVDGDDLLKILEKRQKPFSLEEILTWIYQLLEALDYLHSLTPPIIHRDIKPQNLKLNKWQKVKLLDFGIARSTDKSATATQHTFLGATLNYSPIEQVLRVINPAFKELILLKYPEKGNKILAQDTDARCDIFSLGATIYHLLTNEPPIDVTERALNIWENRADKLKKPSDINPDIPEIVSEWLLKSMELERENRFANAKEMQEGLQKAFAQSETQEFQIPNRTDEKIETEKTNEKLKAEAKTEKLIEIDKSTFETEIEIPHPSTPPISPLTKSENVQNAEVFSAEQTSSTDSNLLDTDFSSNKTRDNLTDQPYVNNEITNEQEIKTGDINVIPTQYSKKSNGNGKYVWTLAIIGLLFFGVFGGGLYGIFSFINYTDTSNTNTSTNTNSKIIPSTQTNLDTEDDDSDVNTEINSDTEIDSNVNTKTTSNTKSLNKPNIQNTAPTAKKKNKTVTKKSTPNTVKPKSTPKNKPKPPQKRQPKAKPTKDPNCIYTNSC